MHIEEFNINRLQLVVDVLQEFHCLQKQLSVFVERMCDFVVTFMTQQ